MRKLVIALVVLSAAAAFAGPIYDVQTGVYTVGDLVVLNDAIVTGVVYNGVFVSEDVTGPYTGVWVYTGGDPGVAQGDLVDVCGEYKEYYGLTELDVAAAGGDGYFTYVGPHMGTLTAAAVDIVTLNADPEAWECCFVHVCEGMVVTNADYGYGMWEVQSYENPSEYLLFDDYWYDQGTVQLGDCYTCAVGIFTYNYDEFKLNPFVDNIDVVDCSVPNESMTFGGVKALYR